MLDFDQRAQEWDAEPRRVLMAQAVADAIQSHVPLDGKWTAMEYGCGTGLVGFLLQPFLGNLVMADSSAGMLQVLQEKISHAGAQNMVPLKLDLTTDAIPEQPFDLVFTSMTLHHIPDTLKIFQTFYQVLGRAGYLCIADLDSEDGSFHGADFTGHKGFDREDLRRKLVRAGFTNSVFFDAYTISKKTDAGMGTFSMFLLVAQK